MTATQADRRITRRAFVSGLGATAATGVGSKYLGSPVGDAEAIAPLLAAGAIGIAAGAVGGLAFGSAIGGPDESEVADSLSWQTHVDEYTRAREDQLMLEQTVASLERDIQLVANKAREEAIFRIYEQAVDSGSESDATDAAQTAIDEAYAVVQEAIIESFNLRSLRCENVLRTFDPGTESDKIGTNGSEPGMIYYTEYGAFNTSTTTLFDGRSITVQGTNYESNSYSGNWVWNDPTSELTSGVVFDQVFVKKPDPADYETADTSVEGPAEAQVHHTSMWYDLLQQLETAHSDVVSEVSSMVSTYYEPAANGEVDLSNMLGPAHLADTASTAKDYQEAAMALRSLGYPMSKQVVTISLPTESGDSLELTGRLSWTAHNGDSLPVGPSLTSSNIVGSVFAAVNLPDGVDSISGNTTNTTNTTDTTDTSTGPGAEIVELTGEFTIESAGGASEVTFKDRSLATADTTPEEAEQVFKENYEANKEATENVHDTATGDGGGGGGFLPKDTNYGLLAAGAGALALGWGYVTGDEQ